MKILGFLVLVVAVVAGVGFYRGWFTIATNPSDRPDDKVSVTVGVDTERIKSDAAAAKRKARDFGGAVAGSKTVQGKLNEVTEGRIVVATDPTGTMDFHLEPDAKIFLGKEEARSKDLSAGDRVTVTYREQDGKNKVQTVTAERSN